VGDLFEHARRRLEVEEPRMRPQHWRERGEAPLVIARNPQARARLPAELLAALDDKSDWLRRRGAVDRLHDLIEGDDPRLRAAGLAEIRRREPDEEHRRVHERMVLVLRGAESPTPVAPPPPPGEGEWPDGHVFKDVEAPWCPEMVVIPAGGFLMGSPEGEKGRVYFEDPQHEVRIAYRFALGPHPVTFAEYDAFCEATGREISGDAGWGRGRRPAINVSWEDASAYCAWLAERTGKPYRLPSEAEWEYACRAGTTTPFWMRGKISTAQANYNANKFGGRRHRANKIYGKGISDEFRGRTVPVDEPGFPANPFGLYQVHGNVWEWVKDCWHEVYEGAPTDGSPWVEKGCTLRVLRGGSWNTELAGLRAASRGRFPHERWDSDIGFRVARMLTP
jgi:formylglycine-generating enzyme required for sulfatase activity